MDEYREKLKITLGITSISALILAVFSCLGFLAEAGIIALTPVTGDSHWQSMWRGLVSGASCGIFALMLVGIIRIISALRNKDKLKKLYVADHDERQIQIWTSARALSMQIFLIGGLVAGIVAGYFNMTVSITILACVAIHSFVALFCKLYYNRKF